MIRKGRSQRASERQFSARKREGSGTGDLTKRLRRAKAEVLSAGSGTIYRDWPY